MDTATPLQGHPEALDLGAPAAPLDMFFAPRTIAVLGASEAPGSLGQVLVANLIGPTHRQVFPITAGCAAILGQSCHPSLASVPDTVDLAIVASPAADVPAALVQCADAGVKGVLIVSSCYRSGGRDDRELEQAMEFAQRRGLRIIGPGSAGLMRPALGLNVTAATQPARAGSVGLLTQSGALGMALVDWSQRAGFGLSAFVSLGSMRDVQWGDLIDYLGCDPQTRSIILYLENLGDARSFVSAAREAALRKPLLVLKPRRILGAACAAHGHATAEGCDDAVFDAALRRSGTLRVSTLAELFCMAELLARQPLPQGPRLTIVTNAGGPGALAADALLAEGGSLAELTPTTRLALTALLPASDGEHNPLDLFSGADAERYARAVAAVHQDPTSDGTLVILTPHARADPANTAQALVSKLHGVRKPLLASWMGGAAIAVGESLLSAAGVATFPYPDSAARAFVTMWRYRKNLRTLYETPSPLQLPPVPVDCGDEAQRLIRQAACQGHQLTRSAALRLLAAYGLPVVQTKTAMSAAEAVAQAAASGYPVVLTLDRDISSPSNEQPWLWTATMVRRAYAALREQINRSHRQDPNGLVLVQPMPRGRMGYRLKLESSVDAQFGPVLRFGAASPLDGAMDDCVVGLPPLTTTLARELLEHHPLVEALQRRSQPAGDIVTLEQMLVRFSELVLGQPMIRSIETYAQLADGDTPRIGDAHITLYDSVPSQAQRPRPAIRPYPQEYVWCWKLADGRPLMIRPVRPEDEPALVQFHQALSLTTIQQRYFRALDPSLLIAHEKLARVCFLDYDREIALVAELEGTGEGPRTIAGLAQLSRLLRREQAEFALLVSDRYQGRGLGGELLGRLIQVARHEGVRVLYGEVLAANEVMQRLCRKWGFDGTPVYEGEVVRVELPLA